jgi:hypothetical protein
MSAISAVDCVSPAIQRTRELLFRPFRWGTYLKLGLVAIVTEGAGRSFNSSRSSGHSAGHVPMLDGPFNIAPFQIAAVVAALLLALVISLFIFYLITRLRFAFFHCLTHEITEIKPGWRIYKEQASRFFWFNVGVGVCFLLLMALAALPFISGFVRLFHGMAHGGKPDFGLLLSLLLPLIPIILLFALAGFMLDIVMRDWMLPHFALDNATAGEAWANVWARIMAEKKQFIVYTLLRVVLPFIAMVALFVVLLIPGLALAGCLASVEFGLHSIFSDTSGASALIGISLEAFFAILAAGFAVLASICLGGPVSTAVREYALVFYGGRYQALGEMLYPTPPPSEPLPPRFA